jgi:lipoprotein-anchoring transpeptidase ErfK/SrfK
MAGTSPAMTTGQVGVNDGWYEKVRAAACGLAGRHLVGNSIMRMRVLLSAVVAAAAAFAAIAPRPALARGELVAVHDAYAPGTIVVRQSQRRLYLELGNGEAIRYPVAVGRAGMQWSGTVSVDGKYVEPAWMAPASIRRDYRKLPRIIPGGSPQNPMGVAALTLSGGGQYAIHGTNQPNLIGRPISHGCIRMYNADISDLYGRVRVGTPVVVTR